MMAQLLEDSSFCEEFIQQCPAAVEVLNLVAQECSPGEHVNSFEQPVSALYHVSSCFSDRFPTSLRRRASWHGRGAM